MSRGLPESGQATALVLVGLMVLAIPAGLVLAQGMTTSPTDSNTVVTPTLPPVNLTETPTPTPTATPTPDNDSNETNGNVNNTDGDGNTGKTLYVNAGGRVGDDMIPQSEPSCTNPQYATIQRGVNAAEPGDTVLVCSGTYPGNVTVEISDLTIRAEGQANIEAGSKRAFNISAPETTIEGFDIRTSDGTGIWVGADRTLIQNNTVQSTENGEPGIYDDGIKLDSTNSSVIRNNTVFGFPDMQISLGENNSYLESVQYYPGLKRRINESTYVRIVGNNITGQPGYTNAGIFVGPRAEKTVIKNNNVTDNRANYPDLYRDCCTPVSGRRQEGIGIITAGNYTDIIGNNVKRNGFDGIIAQQRIVAGLEPKDDPCTDIIGNRVTQNLDVAVTINGCANVIENTIHNNTGHDGDGVGVSGLEDGPNASARILNNRFTYNWEHAIIINNRHQVDHSEMEIHRNLIIETNSPGQTCCSTTNAGFGIRIVNTNKTDGYWPIVDATNNTWGCGGPSSGGGEPKLKDPYTGRKANGNGDLITSGDKPGFSNVHWDPYHELDSCPESTRPTSPPKTSSTPTSPPTPSPTPTPTPTTTTPTPTPTTVAVSGNSTSGPGGSGNSGTDDAGGPSEDGTGKATPPPTATSTATPSPPPTVSPTPVVEPGFGVLAWVVGGALVVGLLTLRRRSAPGSDQNDD